MRDRRPLYFRLGGYMIRGTTPTIPIDVDIDLREASSLYITFVQLDTVIIEKTLSDCTIEEEQISVTLTQEETLSLNDKHPVYVQIRAIVGGAVVGSNIMSTDVGKILKEGII